MTALNHVLLVMLLGGGLMTLAAAEILSIPFVMFIIGMGAGAFLRDIARFRMTTQIWPVFQYIVDWEKVDQLLAADKAGSLQSDV